MRSHGDGAALTRLVQAIDFCDTLLFGLGGSSKTVSCRWKGEMMIVAIRSYTKTRTPTVDINYCPSKWIILLLSNLARKHFQQKRPPMLVNVSARKTGSLCKDGNHLTNPWMKYGVLFTRSWSNWYIVGTSWVSLTIHPWHVIQVNKSCKRMLRHFIGVHWERMVLNFASRVMFAKYICI